MAVGALLLGAVVVAAIVLLPAPRYTVNAHFQNASGLVTGDLVLIGPAKVGTIDSIGLTPDGAANIRLSLDNSVGRLHQGTVARIYEDSLSGIASRYVTLEPGARVAPPIPDGGTIGETHTYSMVALDTIFDTLNSRTRTGLRDVIAGEAASLRGRGQAANRALAYLAPALQSTSQVTAELARDQPTFDQLVVDAGRTMQTLAGRSQQLSRLITDTSTATGAIASRAVALQRALSLFPPTLRRSTTTFTGLRSTLDALDPLVAATKPAARRLPEFATRLSALTQVAIPTVGALDALIHNRAGTGDLTQLAQQTPALAAIAKPVFPRMVHEFNASQTQLDYLREYAPDVVAALSNLGQAGAYYDANGHYVRTQPALFPLTIDSHNQLTMQFPGQRYQGLQVIRSRCPGGAVQPAPDGSAPRAIVGCSPSSVPPGP